MVGGGGGGGGIIYVLDSHSLKIYDKTTMAINDIIGYIYICMIIDDSYTYLVSVNSI